MSQTLLRTTFVALFALLLASPAAMADTADQPVPDAQQPATQAVEAETAPATAAPAQDAPLFQLPIEVQGPPGEPCGDVICPPPFECCNPLENLCVREGQACIL